MSEQQVWDKLAGSYGRTVRFFDTSYDTVRERLAKDLPSADNVLEIAAGTGQFTSTLSQLAQQVLATDVSPEMADRLAKHVRQSGLTNVTCAVMSAYDIQAGAGAFDAIFCANALHIMKTPERALAEFRRVLRGGGRLVAPTFLHGSDIFRRSLSRGLSLVSPFDCTTRFDLDQLGRMVAQAGFDVLDLVMMPGLFPLGYVLATKVEE